MSGLPSGWVTETFGAVADVQLGKMLDKAKNRGEPTAYLRNISVRWGSFDLSDLALMRITAEEQRTFAIRDGDLMVCEGGEPGRAAVWRSGPTPITFQKALMRVRASEAVEPDFLQGFLRYVSTTGELSDHFTGTTIKHLPQNVLRQLQLPVPPLAEQRRIVTKLDALTAGTARARADLDCIPSLAARYRQAVLKMLFAELDREPEKLIDLVDPTRGIPYGIVQTGSPAPSGVPTVRCGDVRPFSVEKANLKIVSQVIADTYPRTLLRGGEVLLAIRGSVGNVAVAGSEFADCNISREVAMIPVGARLRPRFAMFYLGSPEAQAYLKRHVKGVAQTGINLEDVRTLTLPVPDLTVQDTVVQKIDRAFAEIDRLAAEAAAARRLLDRLDQAALAKAFRGELVPQDPTDEPAAVLLDRIRTERASAPKAKRGRAAASVGHRLEVS